MKPPNRLVFSIIFSVLFVAMFVSITTANACVIENIGERELTDADPNTSGDQPGKLWTFRSPTTCAPSLDELKADITIRGVSYADWDCYKSFEQVTENYDEADEDIYGPDPTQNGNLTVYRLIVEFCNEPPTASVSAAATTVAPGRTVQLTATASDSDGTIASYAWETTDGTLSTNTGATVTLTAPQTTGTVTITLTVTDDDGDTTTTKRTLSVAVPPPPNQSPTASVSAATTTVKPGETVQLTATASDSDGTIASYAWETTDGTLNTNTGTTVTLTAPQTIGTVTVTVTVTDDDGSTATAETTVSVTDPRGSSRVVNGDKATFSEIMFEDKNRVEIYPQWIEVYNTSDTKTLYLAGWVLKIETRDASGQHKYKSVRIKRLVIPPLETALIITGVQRSNVELPTDRIYDLSSHHSINQLFTDSGFHVELTDTADTVSDSAGNLDGKRGTTDAPAWPLPAGETEGGARASIMRQYDRENPNIPLDGTEAEYWVSAAHIHSNFSLQHTSYWGNRQDIGSPGYRNSSRPVPVTLSHFRAEAAETGILISWITESELQNVGFNILRGTSKEGPFTKVNPTLILGADTTSERTKYTWKDTTAKSDTAYIYQLQDVSFSGEVTLLATKPLVGFMSAKGKKITLWSDLKNK